MYKLLKKNLKITPYALVIILFVLSCDMTITDQDNIDKIPVVLEAHGDKRIDNYYWMRDDSRKDPKVIEYLKSCLLYTSPSPRD